MKEFLKSKKGITLIALVITIVVLIILAGVIISITLGSGGIIDKAKLAKQEYANAEGYEQTEIAKISNEIDKNVYSSSRLLENREYGYFTMSADGSNGTAETKIPFNTKQEGNMSINSTTYEVSLTAGKTYFISTGIYKGDDGYTFMWIKDNISGQNISKKGFAAGSGDTNGGPNPIQCIYTPTQNTTISVIANSNANNRPIRAGNSFFIVYEL